MHNTCEALMKTNNDDITGKSPHLPVIEHGKRFLGRVSVATTRWAPSRINHIYLTNLSRDSLPISISPFAFSRFLSS